MGNLKTLFITKREINNVKEQFKEFFDICQQYGFLLTSYDVSIIPVYDVDNIKVELVLSRNADFVSIRNCFKDKTGIDLPIPPTLTAKQILGLSLYRPDSKAWTIYRVDCTRFGLLKDGVKPLHRQIFENKMNGHDFDLWPLNMDPHKGCNTEWFNNAYKDAINQCVDNLIRSIEHYNTNNRGNDWYIEFMKEHHPELIPKL